MRIVLIAHSVDFFQEMMTYFLKREGFHPLIFDNISKLGRKLLEEHICYIIRELNIEDSVDAWELDEIRKENPRLKVFGICVKDDDPQLKKYFDDCKVDRVYQYPCDWNQTIAEMKSLT